MEDEQQRECENVFGLVVNILFPEVCTCDINHVYLNYCMVYFQVFIQMLIKQRGISYDDRWNLCLFAKLVYLDSLFIWKLEICDLEH